MNRLGTFLLVFFLIGCSFTKTSFWTQDKKIKEVKKNSNLIFKEKEIIEKEFNESFILKLDMVDSFNSTKDDNTNNLGVVNLNAEIKKGSKFKFSKINNFEYFEPELNFDGKNFIFFDDKGTIFKFNDNFKIIWKKKFLY